MQIVDEGIEKSKVDQRSYRVLKLGSNALKAVVVSDPKADRSGAAIVTPFHSVN